MDEVDRLLRHLEEVAEEIQALRFRLSYLEDHRAEIRESIKIAASRLRDSQQPLALFKSRNPSKPQVKQMRRGAAMSLRQAADTVAAIQGDVDAQRLAETLNISFDAARLRLARAARQGLLVRVKLGLYRAPTDTGSPEVETLTAQIEPRERPSEPSNSRMVKVG
jgi:hypothetical protein